MFRGKYQKGCFSIFYSIGSDPLEHWGIVRKNGYAKRVYDDDIKSLVLELMGTNVSTLYMEIPRNPGASMGVKLPYLVMLIKNMAKYFTFEVKILDDQHFCRRFRISNFQNTTSIKTFCTCMPMGMSPGWNQIHFNLADFTRRAYGTSYMETVHLQVHANIRVRRIYFTDRLYTDDEIPNEFRLTAKPKERQPRRQDFQIPAARPPSPAKSDKTKVDQSDVEETVKEEGETEVGGDLSPAITGAGGSTHSLVTLEATIAGEVPAGEIDEAAANVEDVKPAEEQFYYYY